MQKRRLGQTNLQVSAIGLGTVKFGRNEGVKYPAAFDLPSDQDILRLLTVAAESGINLLDTAPAYGIAEERLGKLLREKRQEWILSTKAGEEFLNGQSVFDFSATALIKSVERSLKRLNTDYLDILLVHSDGNDETLINQEHVFNTLDKLKQEGKIRAHGMSTKTVAGGLATINQADLAMVTYNPIATEEQAVIRHAEQQQKGIFVKKAFASGHLDKLDAANPIQTALRFVLAEPGVTSIIVGTLNPLHLQEIVRHTEEMSSPQAPSLSSPQAF